MPTRRRSLTRESGPLLLPLEPRVFLSVAGDLPYRLYYPEGYASETISEFVPIANVGDATVSYQLIAHFESGDEVSRVIASGEIAPGRRDGVTISSPANPGGNLVPNLVPYALELRSSGPLAAQASRYDRGATGEAFSPTVATRWGFAGAYRADRDGTLQNFLVWQNVADTDATVTVTFYSIVVDVGQPVAEPVTVTVTTPAQRRGGVEIDRIEALDTLTSLGPIGAEITSTVPIVAAFSSYVLPGAITTLGSPNAPTSTGAAPLAQVYPLRFAGNTSLFLLNPSPAETSVIDLRLHMPTGEVRPYPGAVTLEPSSGRQFSVQSFFLDEFNEDRIPEAVGISYAASAPVYGSTVANRPEWQSETVAMPLQRAPSPRLVLAEGFMDPARAGIDVYESVGVLVAETAGGDPAAVSVRFRFTDGTSIEDVRTLPQGAFLLLNLHQYEPLLEQGRRFGRYFYSIEIESSVPVYAGMTHADTTLGTGTAGGGVIGTLAAELFEVVHA